MSIARMVARLSEYAHTKLDEAGASGRARAVAALIKGTLGKIAPAQVVPVTLGEHFGYKLIEIDDQKVIAEAAATTGKKEPATRKEIEAVLWGTVVHKLTSLGVPEGTYDRSQIFGKGKNGYFGDEDAVEFDIGEHKVKMADFVRTDAVLVGELEDEATLIGGVDVKLLKKLKKLEAGDGVVAVVQPELVGLRPGTINHLQTRCFVRDRVDGRVTRAFKGIVMVHPDATNVVAWEDGYGQAGADGNLEIYQMADGNKFNPRSRYTLQGLYYQGIEGWADFLFSQENVTGSVDPDGRMLEERLIAADVPIRAIGGMGLQILLARLTNLTVQGGRARMGLPAIAFRYIRGLEYIAKMELTRDRFDLTDAYDTVMSQHHLKLPPFLAPAHLRKYFDAQGGVGSQWVLDRLPDLPTGKCVIRHELEGYQPFNAFVIPSWSMDPSGNDFDGDILKVLPPTERGGLYVAFNDLTLDEQRRRMKAGSASHSVVKSMYAYTDALERWAGQLHSTQVLGKADLNARRFLDMGDRKAAYAMEVWIDTSVMEQKRPIPYPGRGPKDMPEAKPAVPGMLFGTDLLRDVSKGKKDRYARSRVERDWARFHSKMDALQAFEYVHAQLRAGHDPIHMVGGAHAVALAASWGNLLSERMMLALREVPTYRPAWMDRESTRRWPLPHVIDYPNRVLEPADKLPAVLPKLLSTLNFLDSGWDVAYKLGAETREGLFNIKDALLDVAKALDIAPDLARHATTFRVFRIFATTEQLRDYFKPIAGLRLSELFPHYRLEDALDVAFTPTDTVITNAQPIYLGMQKLDPGQLRLRRPHTTGRFHIKSGAKELELPVLDLHEALLHARATMNRSWTPAPVVVPAATPVVAAA